MRKIISICGMCVLLGAGNIFAEPPTIFYSDLPSAPAIGGEKGKGAYVTLTGRGFGASRGDGYVSVGKGRPENYPVWTDTKITFQLGRSATSGAVTVTNGEGTSNGIPFAIRPGNIYFVSERSPNDPGSGTFENPWRSPQSYFRVMKPGDICYFRGGTYAGRYGRQSYPYNISFDDSVPSGAPGHEIAWVGYPNETARFEGAGEWPGNIDFRFNREHYVIAGLFLYSPGGRENCRIESNNNRIVNCRIEGLKTRSYAMIGVAATAGTKIWGNECFGATSGDKLDHILYCQTGCDDVDFGWNIIHDNNIGVGPVISLNEDGSHERGTVYNDIRIHDNLFDCRNSGEPLRAIGTADAAGGTVFIYNNIFIESGSNARWNHAIYLYSCAVSLCNNTFYRSKGSGSFVINIEDRDTSWHPSRVDVFNNIFFNQPDCGYIRNASTYATVNVNSNCYYGGAGEPPVEDGNAVRADPLFRDPASSDFRLRNGSPCIGDGKDTSRVAPKDRAGSLRVPGKISLGAYEYFITVSSGPAAAPAADRRAGTGQVHDPGDGKAFAQAVPAGRIRIVGSASGKGTVNPGRGDTAKIYFTGKERGRYDLRISSVAGDLVHSDTVDNAQNGAFEWKPRDIAGGIYIATVTGPGFRESGKIAVIP